MMIETNSTLAELAVKRPAASRVFYRHGLDFCCHGNRPLTQACDERGLRVSAIVAEIEAEDARHRDLPRWDKRPLPEVIHHIVDFYHRGLREELPMLIEMAGKVELRHADKPTCPHGLRQHLAFIYQSVLDHLDKEEQVLFPMILAGRGSRAAAPINMMEVEHDDHGKSLVELRRLTSDFTVPAEACPTWRSLYSTLQDFEAELMEHIHLENNVLFRRALCE